MLFSSWVPISAFIIIILLLNHIVLGTTFIPQINNNFNCSFEKGNICNVFWKMTGWSLNTKSDLILDTRWEGRYWFMIILSYL